MTILGSETNRKLRDMGAGCLIDAIESQDDDVCMGLTFVERMQMAVDEAHSTFIEGKVEQLIRRAHLRYPDADIRRIDFAQERKLDRLKLTELATCGYIERGSNVVLQGFTGSGKSYLACALAKEACKRRMRTCYIRIPDLEEEWRASKMRPGASKKLIRKYGNFQVLVLDEWLLDKPDDDFRSMIMELMELRCDGKSTIFCTQYQKKDWHSRLRGGVHADAIMDRIVHNAVWIESGEVNMRAKLSKSED